ncbi:peptidoglycan DD-metalloendopeptidase family protein [Thermocrinis minervae]|uniref:AMIN domain-containing protein n=1 Tax=Thermocrinis minervae TaxID=381751 RepID=A0A1M6RDP3_9AQUI|nr:peptidoglycan DD-metalloendopeptidase family protein [Thermocrinis minervae]SHK30546.1 AMIN domain-containing protein [Thermocrinis minervae]
MVLLLIALALLFSGCASTDRWQAEEHKAKEVTSCKVHFREEKDFSFFRIEANRKVDYRVFTMKNPSRVVLDLFCQDVKVSTGPIRVGKHPWGTRIVYQAHVKKIREEIVSSEPFILEIKVERQTEKLPEEEKPLRVKVPAFSVRGIKKEAKGYWIETSCDEFFRAVEDGQVLYAGNDLKSYGWVLIVKHKDGYMSVYTYASDLLVKRRGEAVKKNQPLGKVGRRDESCGILYELRFPDGSPVKFELER